MNVIGGILAFVGVIGLIVFWVMTLIKQFKSGQTLWGVLTIFINILAPIWCFMNGHKSLAIKYIIALVLAFIGYSILGASMVAQLQNMPPMPQ
jgi:hypothetical protein